MRKTDLGDNQNNILINFDHISPVLIFLCYHLLKVSFTLKILLFLYLCYLTVKGYAPSSVCQTVYACLCTHFSDVF
jgi:hypothetical protein